jgi:hypothetical protein
LLEPQSTNLLEQSEDFSQWGTIGSPTITSNFGISPDGTQNSTRLQFNTNDRIFINVSASGDITFSVYLKGVGQVKLRDNDGSNAKDITLTSEWIRYEFIFNDTITNIQLQQAIGTSDFEIWGAMLEQQSYATSYIPTNGAATTRLQDLANNSGNATLINSTEGVLYAEISGFENDLSNRRISLSDGTTNNSIRIFYYNDGGTIFFRKYVGGVQTSIVTISSINQHEMTKIAIKYNSTNFDIFANGVKLSTNLDSNSFPTNTLNKIGFADGSGSGTPFHGKVKAVVVYKEALTDEQLICLTTI